MKKYIISNIIAPPVFMVLGFFVIFIPVALAIGSMFGIAYLGDNYGESYIFLFLPWFIFLYPFLSLIGKLWKKIGII